MELLEHHTPLSLVCIVSKGLVLMLRGIVLCVKVDWLHDWMQIFSLCCDAIISPLLLDRGSLPAHDAHSFVHDHIPLSQGLQLFLSLAEVFTSILVSGVIVDPVRTKCEVGLGLNLHLGVEVAIQL